MASQCTQCYHFLQASFHPASLRWKSDASTFGSILLLGILPRLVIGWGDKEQREPMSSYELSAWVLSLDWAEGNRKAGEGRKEGRMPTREGRKGSEDKYS